MTQIQVLIVIEESKLRNALNAFLQTEGLQPVTVENLSAADDGLNSQSFDLIFSSEQLPGLSSAETCDTLRARRGGASARLVAVSQSRKPDRPALARAGFDDILDPASEPDRIAMQHIIAARIAATRQQAVTDLEPLEPDPEQFQFTTPDEDVVTEPAEIAAGEESELVESLEPAAPVEPVELLAAQPVETPEERVGDAIDVPGALDEQSGEVNGEPDIAALPAEAIEIEPEPVDLETSADTSVAGEEPDALEAAEALLEAEGQALSEVPAAVETGPELDNAVETLDDSTVAPTLVPAPDALSEEETEPEPEPEPVAIEDLAAAEEPVPTPEPTVRQRPYLDMLKTLGFYLSRGTSRERQGQHVLRAIGEIFPAAKAAIWLRHDAGDRDEMTLIRSSGLSAGYRNQARDLFESMTLDQWASLAVQPQFVPNVWARRGPLHELAASEGFASALHLALVGPGGAVGLLAVYFDEQGELASDDLALLDTIAASTAMAISQTPRGVDTSSDSTYKVIFDHLQDAVFLNGSEGQFLTTNPAMSEISGFSTDDLAELTIFDLLSRDNVDPISDQISYLRHQALTSGGNHRGEAAVGPLPVEIQRIDKRVIRADLFLQPLRIDRFGNDVVLHGTLRKMSESERVRQELEAMQEIVQFMGEQANQQDLDQAMRGVFGNLG